MGVIVATENVRVFIVDDQEPFRSAASLTVELTDGFEVVGESASGEDALTVLASVAPDLVLMDIQMPGMDGIEATRRIATEHPGVRVVVLSTYGPDEFEQRALDAGAIAFITKSEFGPESLAGAWADSD